MSGSNSHSSSSNSSIAGDKPKALTFLQGARDAVPVMLGYLSVSFAFGMIAASRGIPVWCAALFSGTALTGTGQFVGLDLISAGAGFIELACTLAVINARYFLMSLSLGQKLPANITLWQRCVIAFGNTDENFAIAMMQTKPLTFPYLCGMIVTSYCGWVGGTILGGAAQNLIPQSVLSALGIALYAMFIALVVPPAMKNRKILLVVSASVAISCVFSFTPALSGIGSGWIIIISGVAASVLGALLFPVETAGQDSEKRVTNE